MKNFLLGLLVATIAGVLSSIAYGSYQDWRASRSQVIRYEANTHPVLVTPDLLAQAVAAEPGEWLHSVHLANTGREDLDNLDITLASELPALDAIKAAGVLRPIEDAGQPVIEVKDNQAHVRYKLLKSGQGAVLWVRSTSYRGIQLKTDRKGLAFDVANPNDILVAIWPLITYGGIALVAFILGIVVAEITNRSVLRRIGLDPDEVTELYKKAVTPGGRN